MTREKAIKIVKEFINGTCLHLVDQEALETLIPELAESEDERIKKDIINLIYWLKANPSLCSQYYKDRYDGILAWLEKQKEQKPSIFPPGLGEVHWNPIPSAKKGLMEKPAEPSGKPSRQEYLYHLLANGVITFSDYEFLMKNKGRKPADLSEMMVHKEPYIAPVPTPMVADEQGPAEKQDYTTLTDIERAINRGFLSAGVINIPVEIIEETAKECIALMKPAEWSDEDKDKLYQVMEILLADKAVALRDTPHCKILHEAYDKMLAWLKSLPERFNLQPKQEWSEEDKKMLGKVLECIRFAEDHYQLDEGQMNGSSVKLWLLNHINPQPSWKPSEEQMKALDKAIPVCMGVVGRDEIAPLESLYEQLKKLINIKNEGIV